MATPIDNNMNGMKEKGETRLLGVGLGVFVIFFVSLVSFLVCLVGATTPRPGAFVCGGTGLFALVLLVLLVAERESRYVVDKSDQVQVYDQTFYPRLSLALVLVIAVLTGMGNLCRTHFGKPIHAVPMYDKQTSNGRRPIF